MVNFMNQFSQSLAAKSSRGGFPATLVKASVLGAGVLGGGASALAGGGLGVAEAACTCCPGCNTPCGNGCPANSCQYTGGQCCTGGCGTYVQQCYSCLDCNTSAFVCAFSSRAAGNKPCPCAPA